MAVVVPFAVLVQVELACGFYHGFEVRVLGLFGRQAGLVLVLG